MLRVTFAGWYWRKFPFYYYDDDGEVWKSSWTVVWCSAKFEFFKLKGISLACTMRWVQVQRNVISHPNVLESFTATSVAIFLGSSRGSTKFEKKLQTSTSHLKMVIKFICQLFYPSLLSLSPARVYEDRGDFFFSFHFLVFSFRRQRRHRRRATVLSEWLNVECVGLRASLEWLIIWSMLIVVIADDTHTTQRQ